MWVGGTVGPLCPLGPDLPVRPCRNQADALFFTDCTATHRICDLVSFSDTVYHQHLSKGDFKKHSFIHTYPCSLFTVGTWESWESKRSLKEEKKITSTRFHTKDDNFNKYIFSKYMRVSFPDLWSLSSMISRKSWNTQFTLQSHDDIKQWQMEKKSCSHSLRCKHRNHSYLVSALSLYSWNEISLMRFYLLSYCSKWSSLTRGANTTFRPLWTVLSSGPWYSNFTLLQIRWIKTNVT